MIWERYDDGHSSLGSHILGKSVGGGIEFVAVERTKGWDQTDIVLHAYPNQWTSSGMQTTDVLLLLGFQRWDNCPYTSGRRCFYKVMPVSRSELDVEQIADLIRLVAVRLKRADHLLEQCGLGLPKRGGWAFFYGR